MSNRSIRRWAKAAAMLTLAAAISGTAVSRHLPRQQPPLLLSLEFAASPEEVRRLTPRHLEEGVRRAQRDDNWLFIPNYWALFAASGVVLVVSGGSRNRRLGIAAIAVITAAAIFDYAENAAIAAALDPAAGSGATPLPWARAKWVSLFLAAAAIGVALALAPERRRHGVIAAALLSVAGVSGMAASLVAHELVNPATAVLAAGLFSLALLWIWNPTYLAGPS